MPDAKLNASLNMKDNATAVIERTKAKTKDLKNETSTAQKAMDTYGQTAANAGKKAEGPMKRLLTAIKGTGKAAADAGKETEEAGEKSEKAAKKQEKAWGSGAVSIAAAAYTAKKAWDAAMGAINMAALQKVQETTFQALTNSKKAGSALYGYVSEYAKVSAFGREELANATTAYITYAKSTAQLERMIKLTERLYAKDPSQGARPSVKGCKFGKAKLAEVSSKAGVTASLPWANLWPHTVGLVFAMRELLSGDTMSIKSRFNMSGFSGAKIRAFADTGDIEGLLGYVDEMFNRFGATQEVVDANFNNLMTQTNIFASNMKTAIAESAAPAMETLAGVMQRLNKEMATGKYQPFINLMGNGMRLIGSGIAWVTENLNWLAPVVVGATTAFIVYKGVQMAAATATMVFSAVTSAATGNVLGLISALAGLATGVLLLDELNKDITMQTDMDLNKARETLAGFEKGFPSMSQTLPVEVTNSAPISVKGQVEIEEESLKYMLDIKGQQWLAKFTTATLAPQNNFYGTVIRETADFEEFTQATIDSLHTAIEVAPTL